MSRSEVASLGLVGLTVASVFAFSAADAPNSSRHRVRRAPRLPRVAPRAPILLNQGDSVSIGGILYTVGAGLIPVTAPVPPPGPALSAYQNTSGQMINSGVPGSLVVIQGTNLGTTGAVSFNGLPAATTAWSATSLTATVPTPAAYPNTGPISVTVAGQTGFGPNFSITAKPTPPPPDMAVYAYRNGNRDYATVFSPGQTIFIVGKGFQLPPGTVSVNHANVPVVTWTDTEIQIVCPALATGATGGPAALDIIRADHGDYSSTMAFVILPAPTRFGNR